jgi:hypothetical protein
MGHSRVDTTQNIYVEGLAERQREVAQDVEELLYKRKRRGGDTKEHHRNAKQRRSQYLGVPAFS